jgi:hypothetical protein
MQEHLTLRMRTRSRQPKENDLALNTRQVVDGEVRLGFNRSLGPCRTLVSSTCRSAHPWQAPTQTSSGEEALGNRVLHHLTMKSCLTSTAGRPACCLEAKNRFTNSDNMGGAAPGCVDPPQGFLFQGCMDVAPGFCTGSSLGSPLSGSNMPPICPRPLQLHPLSQRV